MSGPADADTLTQLRQQWSNPADIFTVLMVVGGDIVKAAIAQLCGGPLPYLTPVSFSFGWVSYSVSAVLSAVGDNRLMPRPELNCVLINTASGYGRSNGSWVLSRLLRDYEYWRTPDSVEAERLKMEEIARRGLGTGWQSHSVDSRIAFSLSVWDYPLARARGSGDASYWSGFAVTTTQLCVAALPWIWYREWFTFLTTAAGTILAYCTGALPQWHEEKLGVRALKADKDVILTEGNGARQALLIRCCKGSLDLEALAGLQRHHRHNWTTRVASTCLAACWVTLLATVAGWRAHTWYVVAVGMLGIVHNIAVAGKKRCPEAWGLPLVHKQTFADDKVMKVLWAVEEAYPGAGACLVQEFFPGMLNARETLLWDYAKKRSASARTEGLNLANLWPMPPLRRSQQSLLVEDRDIPKHGPYELDGDETGQ